MLATTFNKLLFFCLTFSILLGCQSDLGQKMDNSVFSYPTTIKQDVFDMFHGEKVPDPYKWLEDDRSKETADWVNRQNNLSGDYISHLPQRKAIHKRLQSLWSYERYQNPTKIGEYYYYLKNDGLQNQDILYKQKGLEGESTIVLDPNTFSADGTASLGAINFSPNGKYLAYQKSVGGSDWHEVFVIDLETEKELSDKIEWVKFSEVSWTDNGFYYSRYPAPKEGQEKTSLAQNQTVYFHKLGTDMSEDETIYFDRANPIRGFNIFTTENDSIQVLQSWESTSGNALSVRSNRDKGFAPIIESFEHDYDYIGNLNDNLYFLTNAEAENKKIAKLSTTNIENPIWETVVNESEDVISSAAIYGNKLVLNYIHKASSKIKIFNTEGKLSNEVELPGIGTVQSMTGSKKENQTFFAFASYTQPTSIYTLDVENGKVNPYKIPKITFESEKYITKQEIFTSKDGTEIPMFISHKKGLKMDGQRPTMLYGYGGFNISILPSFNTSRLSMAPIIMENDGIFAVANIRGGGEFGSNWHKSGTKENKQNVFDDFIAAAEFLKEKGYTSSEKLAAYGRSNGGLLIGACMTQRPDLFHVALPAVGVLDMLHYEQYTIGWAWASDYGSVKEEKAYRYLKAYSPVHNATPQDYPATLITTADHDDRVVPAHSFKFAAALQEAQKGDNPIMIRVGISAGHGDGKSTEEKINEAADVLAFTFYNFGLDVYER
jgi:prolyl oligopeptidase